MRKLSIGLLFVCTLFCAENLRAQCASYTQVTGTVTDPNSVPWAGAALSVDLSTSGSATCTGPGGLQAPFSTHFTTTLDSTGSFAIQLPANSTVTPAGTKWIFSLSITVPPPVGRGNQRISYSATISGSTQSLSSALSALSTDLLYGGSSSGGSPCTSTPNALQKDNAGAFACVQAVDNGTYLSVNEPIILTSEAFQTQDDLVSPYVLENGNFEEGPFANVPGITIPGWNASGNASISLDTTTPYEGSASLILTTTTGANDSAAPVGAFVPIAGHVYEIIAAMHGDGTLVPTASIIFTDNAGTASNVVTATGAAGTSWGLYSATGSPVAGATNGTIKLAPSTAAAGTTEYDAIQLLDLTAGSFRDVPLVSAPANPASGYDRLYGASGSGDLACLTSAGANCLPSSGSTSWSALTNPSALLDLSMGANASDFEWTASGGAVNSGFQWDTNTPASSGQNNSSPWLKLCGDYFTGGGSQNNCWQLQQVIGTGATPNATLTFENSGTGGFLAIAPAVSGQTSLGTAALPWSTLYTGNIQAQNLATGTPADAVCTDSSGNFIHVPGANCYTGTGGAVTYTTSQTLTSANANQAVYMQSASAVTATLPATVPSSTWSVAIIADSTGAVSVDPNGLTLHVCGQTQSTPFTIPAEGQSEYVTVTGSNYAMSPCPLKAGTNFTLTPSATGLVGAASGGSAGLWPTGAVAPTFSPTPGTYSSTQTVSVTCPGTATGYVSLSPFTTPSATVSVSATGTVEGSCQGGGFANDNGTGSYTIVAGAPTFVQGGSCIIAAGTCTVTLGAAVTAGHYLVVYEGANTGTNSTPTMTGETFTHEANASNFVGFTGDAYLDSNATGGQTVLTCTNSGASGGCSVAEYTSPGSGHSIDASGNAHATTTAMSVATSTANATNNDACIGFGYSGQTAVWTAGGGWTARVQGSANQNPFMEDQPFPTAGTETATATAPSGATNIAEGIICLKP